MKLFYKFFPLKVKRDYVYRTKNKNSYKKLFYQLLISIIIVLLIIFIKSFDTSFTNKAIQLVKNTVQYNYDFKKLGNKVLKYAKDDSNKTQNTVSVFRYQNNEKTSYYTVPTTGIIYKKFGEITKGNVRYFHRGVDILADSKKVYSIEDGIISEVYEDKVLGKCVRVDFGEIEAVYANMDDIYVIVGQKITRGEELGTLKEDNKGNRILHFEIWKDNAPVNPLDYINVSK